MSHETETEKRLCQAATVSVVVNCWIKSCRNDLKGYITLQMHMILAHI